VRAGLCAKGKVVIGQARLILLHFILDCSDRDGSWAAFVWVLLFFGERVWWLRCIFVWVGPLSFWPRQLHFWVAGLSASFVLQQHCITCAVVSLFGGTVSSFWGGVLLFLRRQCCLFGGIVGLAVAAAFLGGEFAGSICLAAALHCLLSSVFGLCLGTASSFWGWCVVVLADVVLFVWWWWHHGKNMNFVLHETVLHIY
jgi:hypothetical protein